MAAIGFIVQTLGKIADPTIGRSRAARDVESFRLAVSKCSSPPGNPQCEVLPLCSFHIGNLANHFLQKVIGLLLLLTIIGAAAAADHGAMRVSTTACNGKCPVYTFYLFADDKYVFDGREFTKRDRIEYGKLRSGTFVELIRLLETRRFDEFEDHYGLANIKTCKEFQSDSPSTTIQVQTTNINKSVYAYWGCVGFRRESDLLAIDQAITNLLIREGLLVNPENEEP